MRTVITIPDGTFERATRAATALGITMSEFVERAVERYIGELSGESLTERVNAAVDRVGETDASNHAAAEAGRRRLSETFDEW